MVEKSTNGSMFEGLNPAVSGTSLKWQKSFIIVISWQLF
jgi:hypothetical protein